MAQNVLAHSDDEDIPGENAAAIKTLPYRGKNSSKFWRRVDKERIKEAQLLGKQIRAKVRKLPKVPIMSTFTKAPNDFPIDFYDPTWYNNLQAGQKRLVANENKVAFLPDASKSLLPVRHPDEKLGDRAFIAKYLDILREPYQIPTAEDETGLQDDEESGESLGSRDSDDMDRSDQDEDDSEDSDFYSEGETGDLYEDKDVVVGKGKGKSSDGDDTEGEGGSANEMDDE